MPESCSSSLLRPYRSHRRSSSSCHSMSSCVSWVDGPCPALPSKPSPDMSSLPVTKRVLFALATTFAALLALGLVGEVVLRLLGHHAWDPNGGVNPVVEPGGTLFAPHPSLGYALLP